MNELLRIPLTDLVERLKRRVVSATEVMNASLEAIAENQERLNAFVLLRDPSQLLEEALVAQNRLDRAEGRLLEGIPFAVKDLEDVAGLVTSYGSVAFRDNVAPYDSIQVARLKAAGAIVIGKTNTSEFGYTAVTKNELFGVTRNPWDPQRSPGGSSGGAAAAISAGLVPMVTASDGGGSIRLPANFCGCIGFKPTYGRVARGPNALWNMNDTGVDGPLVRSVADAALQLDATAGPHALDPNSLPAPAEPYRSVLDRLPEKLRIGFSSDLGYAIVQSDIRELFGEHVKGFESLGHDLVEITTPAPDCMEDWIQTAAFDLASLLHETIPARESEFGGEFLEIVKSGWEMSPERWGAIRKRREELNRWCAHVFDDVDLLLTPTTTCDPPAAEGPLPTEIEGQPVAEANIAAFTLPFNLCGQPAVSVPAGRSRAGLPVGLQIAGPRGRDELVLQAAQIFEQLQA